MFPTQQRIIDGCPRSFWKPQFQTAIARGNVATLSATPTLTAAIVIPDEIVGHQLVVNWSAMVAAAVTLTGPSFIVTVNNPSNTMTLSTGTGGIGGTPGVGNSGVLLAWGYNAPVAGVDDQVLSGSTTIDLRQGVWAGNTPWSIFLSGNPGDSMTILVSITLSYNGIPELRNR